MNTDVPPAETSTPIPTVSSADLPGLSVIANPASASPGQTVAVTLNLSNVSDLYGLQARCTVDPAVLTGTNHTGGDGFNDGNSFFVDTGFNPADGTWNVAASRLQPNQPISGTGVAFILNYTVQTEGSTAINCDIMGVDINGYDVSLQVYNAGFTSAAAPSATPTEDVPPTETPLPTFTPEPPTATPTVEVVTPVPGGQSIISGVVNYPGATDHSNITVALLAADQTPLVQITTNANGAYRFTEVPVGLYILQISAPQSLTIQMTVLVENDGVTVDLGTILLPMGDTDDSGTIDLNDASLVGVNFGVDGGLVPNADLNHDTSINIRDLVLVGKNFGLTAPVMMEQEQANP